MNHEELRPLVLALANHAKNTLPAELGFTILVFEFGQEPGLGLAYASNADRVNMLATMREFLARPEHVAAISDRLNEILAEEGSLIEPVPVAEARDKDVTIACPRALIRRLLGDIAVLGAFVDEYLPQVKEIGVFEYMRRRIERADQHVEALGTLAGIDSQNEDLDD